MKVLEIAHLSIITINQSIRRSMAIADINDAILQMIVINNTKHLSLLVKPAVLHATDLKI